MIIVTIQYKGKQIQVVCNRVAMPTKNQVTCYDYNQDDDKVVSTTYNGYIVEVEVYTGRVLHFA